MEVVDKIREARTGNVGPYQNVPNPPVIIKTARVLATKK
jgi:peptidyl-prolyl cis-trans isomerase A (cyclophilin A)